MEGMLFGCWFLQFKAPHIHSDAFLYECSNVICFTNSVCLRGILEHDLLYVLMFLQAQELAGKQKDANEDYIQSSLDLYAGILLHWNMIRLVYGGER